MSKHIKSYPKVLQIHQLEMMGGVKLSEEEWVIEEKADGSLFKCAIENGKINIGSKSVDMIIQNERIIPQKMFLKGIDYVLENKEKFLSYSEGTVFYFEYLDKPKHNTLCYERVPKNNLMLFDVRLPSGFMIPQDLGIVADVLGVEAVPILGVAELESVDDLEEILKQTSFLGGPALEGVVLKNYQKLREREPNFGEPVFAKWVREDFKELNHKEWKKEGKQDIMLKLMDKYATKPRWEKAVQHLKDGGKIENELKDLALIIPEVIRDTLEEEEESIKNMLWEEYKKDFSRRLTSGLPEWYKRKLVEG